MRIALVFLPPEKSAAEESVSNIIVEEYADLVLTKLADTDQWAVSKSEFRPPLTPQTGVGRVIEGGDAAARHVQLAVLEKLGVRKPWER
jgi:hypothetical protein